MKSVFNYVKMIILDLVKAIAATIIMTVTTFVSMILFTVSLISLCITGDVEELSPKLCQAKTLLTLDWKLVKDGWKFGPSQLDEEYMKQFTEALEDAYYDV